MKNVFIKIASALLSFLVLISTFSFTIEKHYCGDFLVDVSYTGNLEVCISDIAPDTSVKMKKCCKDEIHQIKGQDELQKTSLAIFDFENQQFLATFIFSYVDLFSRKENKNNFYKDFSPPDILLDYQVRYQIFLI